MGLGLTPAIRDLVWQRDGHYCARCHRSITNQPSSIHHRKARGMGGTTNPLSNDPRNLIRLCGTGTTGCHGQLESRRRDALEAGWLIRTYGDLDAPMVTLTGVRVFLFPDGTRHDVPPQLEPPT